MMKFLVLIIAMFTHEVWTKNPLLPFGSIGDYWVKIPEMNMNVSQLIENQGYPVENHDVVTEDGYILSLQRIPHGKDNSGSRKSIPVLLQHGLMDSSATWVINQANESLGFILADAGYDVWLANSRGNTYSKRHTKLSTEDAKFWDFSFEELAKYDLPACINYILKKTNSTQVNYVGHSQGTTIGFLEFSRNQALGKKVKDFVALAPAVKVQHIKGIFKYLAKGSTALKIAFKLFGVKQFLPSNALTKYFANLICASKIVDNVCAGFLFLMCGYDTSNLNRTRMSAYLAHTPAGASVKDVLHFSQMVKSGKFRQYDYGYISNRMKYGTWTPPEYDITTLQTPVSLFSGSDDWMATPKDIDESIRGKVKSIVYDQRIQGWNHLDFVWGVDAANLVYNKIVNIFDKA